MKKFLLLAAVLVLGTTAFAAKVSAPVKVRAEIVDESLVISDIDGRPILLDFGKIAKERTSDANAFVDFKIESTGELTDTKLTLVLGKSTGATVPDEVTLTNIDATLTGSNTVNARLLLDKYSADGVNRADAGVIHTGRINGTMKAGVADKGWEATTAVGVYEGQTELTVTTAQ